mmetsp:Transcript_29028/g.81786  ORF Transcript_29028/g.81786 Transcript_29028/m.81786 type:complete len:230 (-) Transcript_29028:151-840(-)
MWRDCRKPLLLKDNFSDGGEFVLDGSLDPLPDGGRARVLDPAGVACHRNNLAAAAIGGDGGPQHVQVGVDGFLVGRSILPLYLHHALQLVAKRRHEGPLNAHLHGSSGGRAGAASSLELNHHYCVGYACHPHVPAVCDQVRPHSFQHLVHIVHCQLHLCAGRILPDFAVDPRLREGAGCEPLPVGDRGRTIWNGILRRRHAHKSVPDDAEPKRGPGAAGRACGPPATHF